MLGTVSDDSSSVMTTSSERSRGRKPRSHQIEGLRKVVAAYAAASGLAIATVSSRATGDGAKLPAVMAGADMTTRRFDLTLWWFSDNWPENAAWPADVARP